MSLEIGELALTPSFSTSVLEYTAATTNLTDIIDVVASKADAAIVIDVDGTVVDNGDPISWAEGENVVTITVSDDALETVYEVTVTATRLNSMLATLTIADAVLDPTFNGAVSGIYTATATTATSLITATATDTNSIITIEVDDVEVEDNTATWAEGINNLVITVTNGYAETVYEITVTYTAE